MWCRSCPLLNLFCKRLSTMECKKTEHDYHFSAYADMIQTADGLCESSALVQHVSVTVCHPEFLEHKLTVDMHWFRLPIRKIFLTFTVYLSEETFLFLLRKNSLTTGAHPSNCQLKKKNASLRTEFDPQNNKMTVCIIQGYVPCLPTSLYICTLWTYTEKQYIPLSKALLCFGFRADRLCLTWSATANTNYS